jgi:transcriptional regulator with XRE-family HTH domain
MGKKLRQYTPIGKRIDALCGPQHRIAAALGLDRSQVSRKFRDEVDLTVNELIAISNYFDIPIWLFFTPADIDDEVLAECRRMFLSDPIALDHIIEAFNIEHKNLKRLGEKADEMRRAHNREKRKKGKRDAVSGS